MEKMGKTREHLSHDADVTGAMNLRTKSLLVTLSTSAC